MTANLENVQTIDLDEWLTLNTAASPTRLLKGQTPNAKNVWVDEKPGSVITANGYVKVGELPSGNPGTFCMNFFKSDGTELFIVSDNSTVYKTVDFQNYTSIITGLSASFQLRGAVIRDKIWLTNGSDNVRTYDGSSVVVLDGTGALPDVPKGRYIAYHDERVWLYHLPSDRSSVRFSALADSSGTAIAPDHDDAWPTDNELQISESDGDFGTGLILYNGVLYAFKQYSIYKIVGFDEYTYSRVKVRASTGSRFQESIQIKDNLIHLIGVDGIYVFNGDEAERISDLVDPSAASQTAFGFNQIQQPNTNNQFWQTSASADWNSGDPSDNLAVDDGIALVACDTDQADFAAGATTTNIDYTNNANAIQLSVTSSGVSGTNAASGATGVLTPTANTGTIGAVSMLTDSNITNAVGFSGSPSAASGLFGLTGLNATLNYTTVVLKSVVCGTAHIEFESNLDGDLTPSGTSQGSISGNSVLLTTLSGTDVSVTFPSFNASEMTIAASFAANTSFTCTEIQIFTAAYNTTGSFVSKTLDLGQTPSSTSMGFTADYSTPSGTTATFYTQSSADGSTWDSAVLITAGAIGSTLRRYLRWRVDFTSNGTNTPVVTAAYLPGLYQSPIHDTGGSIYTWGPVESEYALNGEPVNFYYRTATTSGGVSGASWNLIVPGGVINSATNQQYVQFKVEITAGSSVGLPEVSSVTVNWVEGSAGQPQTLQNVASYVWKNRYWLACAQAGADENDTILVAGKKTFKSPWQLKDWPILSFTRFHDDFYGCASDSADIYRLDTGYSKDGDALNSYFETGDFTFGGFHAYLSELLLEVERLGSYSLTVGVSIDQGATWTEKTIALTESSFASHVFAQLNFTVNSDRIRFRVGTNAADNPFEVHKLSAFYQVGKSRGSIR